MTDEPKDKDILSGMVEDYEREAKKRFELDGRRNRRGKAMANTIERLSEVKDQRIVQHPKHVEAQRILKLVRRTLSPEQLAQTQVLVQPRKLTAQDRLEQIKHPLLDLRDIARVFDLSIADAARKMKGLQPYAVSGMGVVWKRQVIEQMLSAAQPKA